MGRTGVFIALDYFQQRIAEMTPDDVLDVFEFVLKMRNNRLQMVQNLVSVYTGYIPVQSYYTNTNIDYRWSRTW